jgi:hypothetical protein
VALSLLFLAVRRGIELLGASHLSRSDKDVEFFVLRR